MSHFNWRERGQLFNKPVKTLDHGNHACSLKKGGHSSLREKGDGGQFVICPPSPFLCSGDDLLVQRLAAQIEFDIDVRRYLDLSRCQNSFDSVV